MKDDILLLSFEPQDTLDEALGAFLDSVFQAGAINYTADNKLQYVGYADASFDLKAFKQKALMQHITLPSYHTQILKNKNWLAETAARFDPIEAGDFIIYDIQDHPADCLRKIPLKIDGSIAFGSTHETTHLCLQALSELHRNGFTPHTLLDIGTGSGILAIAAAKIWAKSAQCVLGDDIDADSVRLAIKNAEVNGVAKTVHIVKGSGYHPHSIKQHLPFDLVFANILARPLISIAKKSAEHIASGGFMILSGFRKDQTDWVLSAYQKEGFKTVKTYSQNGWCAALIQKKQTISDLQQNLEDTDAYFILRDNMFLGEDILESENKILEISGFTGSAGAMIISKHRAYLLVDGRYRLQARFEAHKNIEVVDSAHFIKDAVKLYQSNHFSRLIVHPWTISAATAEYLTSQGVVLKLCESAPHSDFFSNQSTFVFNKRFAGLSSKQKCLQIAKAFPENVDALLITSAEELSWISNLRAKDLPYTPVLRAFGLLKRDGKLKIYRLSDLGQLQKDMANLKRVMADFSKTPCAFTQNMPCIEDVRFEALTCCKLQKNDVELSGFQKAHIRDGVALVKFFAWLETHYHGLSELDAVNELHILRAKQKHYFSESFATIAAVQKNAAVVHYEPTVKTNQKMPQNTLLLLDSGAQYFDGTTDVTRTIAFGRTGDEIKTAFTEVLKAHIALAGHIFDEGTPACMLDKICRDILLAYGKDYAHGTGHSVGHFSNVHESPFAINARNATPVLAHYVTSIEPGYYLENKYGIRIENLVYTEYTPDHKHLCFQPLTLCPIDTHLIKPDMLTDVEKTWLNTYHRQVFEALAPHLNKQQKTWLAKKCQKI